MRTFEMTPSQLFRARRLIRKECCNFDPDHEECVILDNGRGRFCPQYNSYSMMCYYFRDTILPLDEKLRRELLPDERYRRCRICGTEFIATGRASRYCKDCAVEHRKMLDRERKRRAKAEKEK